MRKIVVIIFTMCFFCTVMAQEFRCSVQVNYQKLLTTQQAYGSENDKKVFESMKQAIEDFVNGRRWTGLQFEPQEKIDMSLSLILNTRSSATEFGGQVQLQLRRPVFGSTYTTGLFNYMEPGEFKFVYNESQSLDFDPNNYYSNLTSMIGFYCYIFLGMYFDSFSPNGGEPFYQLAQQVQQSAEGSGAIGWTSSADYKSRYWFMENHINSAYETLHSAYYKYHRLGLDMMTRDQAKARKAIIEALDDVKTAAARKPNVLSGSQFAETKVQELMAIFGPAPVEEKQQVFDLMKAISPINAIKMKEFNTK